MRGCNNGGGSRRGSTFQHPGSVIGSNIILSHRELYVSRKGSVKGTSPSWQTLKSALLAGCYISLSWVSSVLESHTLLCIIIMWAEEIAEWWEVVCLAHSQPGISHQHPYRFHKPTGSDP